MSDKATRDDACAVYLLSFMLIKQKSLIFKKGHR